MTSKEFAALCKHTGLKYTKIGELCGKCENTIRQYCCKTEPPLLVVEKVMRLDALIHGESEK